MCSPRRGPVQHGTASAAIEPVSHPPLLRPMSPPFGGASFTFPHRSGECTVAPPARCVVSKSKTGSALLECASALRCACANKCNNMLRGPRNRISHVSTTRVKAIVRIAQLGYVMSLCTECPCSTTRPPDRPIRSAQRASRATSTFMRSYMTISLKRCSSAALTGVLCNSDYSPGGRQHQLMRSLQHARPSTIGISTDPGVHWIVECHARECFTWSCQGCAGRLSPCHLS